MKKISFFQVLKNNLECAFCKEKNCPARYYPDKKKRLHYEGTRFILRCKNLKRK
ncbi:MAG: hypothetical protein J6C46_04235 [Clostridia bacterium]|nr:hypothetical protein [Clostridia bacterium]